MSSVIFRFSCVAVALVGCGEDALVSGSAQSASSTSAASTVASSSGTTGGSELRLHSARPLWGRANLLDAGLQLAYTNQPQEIHANLSGSRGTTFADQLGEAWNVSLYAADDFGMYEGCAFDTYRWCDRAVLRDRPGVIDDYAFGSAHPSGAHFVMCDGSVHVVRFGIDLAVHARLGARADGQPVDVTQL